MKADKAVAAVLHVTYKMLILEFPSGCSTFQNPHDVDCYQSMWIGSGCSQDGLNYPSNMSELDMDFFNADLR